MKKQNKEAVATVQSPIKYEYILDSINSTPFYSSRRYSLSLPELSKEPAAPTGEEGSTMTYAAQLALRDLETSFSEFKETADEDTDSTRHAHENEMVRVPLQHHSDSENESPSLDSDSHSLSEEKRDNKEDNEKDNEKGNPSLPSLPWYILAASRKDVILTSCVLIWFIIVSFVSSIAVSYTDRFFNSSFAQRLVLSDVVTRATFSWFVSSGIPPVSDILGILSAVLLALRLLLLRVESFRITRRVLIVLSLVYLIRTICILLTILPSPNLDCKSFPLDNIFLDALVIMFNARNTCGDVFFSGNCVIFTACALLWIYRPINHPSWLKWISMIVIIAYNSFACVFVVVTAADYSITAIMGIVITWMTWSLIWNGSEIQQIKYSSGIGSFMGRIDDPLWSRNAKAWRERFGKADVA